MAVEYILRRGEKPRLVEEGRPAMPINDRNRRIARVLRLTLDIALPAALLVLTYVQIVDGRYIGKLETSISNQQRAMLQLEQRLERVETVPRAVPVTTVRPEPVLAPPPPPSKKTEEDVAKLQATIDDQNARLDAVLNELKSRHGRRH